MLDYSGPTHTDPTVYINFPYKTNEGPKLYIYVYRPYCICLLQYKWMDLRFHKPICTLPIFFYKTDEGILLLRSNCMCLLPLQYKWSNRWQGPMFHIEHQKAPMLTLGMLGLLGLRCLATDS